MTELAPSRQSSGYQAKVRAYREGDETMFEVVVTYRLEAKYWPELRQAVDDALAMVSKHPIAALPLSTCSGGNEVTMVDEALKKALIEAYRRMLER